VAKKRSVVSVTDVSQIPDSVPSEDDEREWWGTHDLSEDVIAQMQEGLAEANEWLARFRREYRRTHPKTRGRRV